MVWRERNRSALRRVLERERAWALYALADLDDGLFEQCEWYRSGEGLALVFHGLGIRPIFVMGSVEEVRALLAALPTASGYLNLREQHVGAEVGLFGFRQRHEMSRMMLGRFVSVPGSTVPLTRTDLAEIQALYASGDGGGIAFAPVQLDSGVFRGVRERGQLVAVAGVQVLSRAQGVAAVGNVFVRADVRGRGLAQTALSATVSAVLGTGVETIGLNVERSNVAAIRAYENLGFREALRYVEGPADRAAPPESLIPSA